jgi:hypothetical protein
MSYVVRPTGRRDPSGKYQDNDSDAERIDAKKPPDVEGRVQLPAAQPKPPHGHHEHKTCMNKEKKHPPTAQSPKFWVPLGNSKRGRKVVD